MLGGCAQSFLHVRDMQLKTLDGGWNGETSHPLLPILQMQHQVQESLDCLILWAVGTTPVLLSEAAAVLKHCTRRISAFWILCSGDYARVGYRAGKSQTHDVIQRIFCQRLDTLVRFGLLYLLHGCRCFAVLFCFVLFLIVIGCFCVVFFSHKCTLKSFSGLFWSCTFPGHEQSVIRIQIPSIWRTESFLPFWFQAACSNAQLLAVSWEWEMGSCCRAELKLMEINQNLPFKPSPGSCKSLIDSRISK